MTAADGVPVAAVACAAAGAAAVALAMPVPHRPLPAGICAGRRPRERRAVPARVRAAARAVPVLLGACLVAGLQVRAGPVVALAAAIVGGTLGVLGRQRGRQRRAARLEDRWRAALERCASELRAGAPLPSALHAAAAADRPAGAADPDAPAGLLPAAAATLEAGGAPGALLGRRGGETGRALAACLSVAGRIGAPPAPLILELAAAQAALGRQRRDLDVALATARATGRLLAVLPLAGVALAAGLGTSAPRFLLGSPAGRLCLLTGACLESAGLCWLHRLTRPAPR